MLDKKAVAQEVVDRYLDYDDKALNYFSADELIEILDEVCNKLNYMTYEDACVINVKGRPNIQFSIEDLNKKLEEKDQKTIIDEEFYEALDRTIGDFAENLQNEGFPLAIKGRMNGYWGLADVDQYLEISPLGKERLVEELINKYNEVSEEENLNEEDMKEDISYLFDLYLDDIFEKLLYDDNNFKLNEDFVLSMEMLEKAIDEEEKELQDIDVWVDYFSKEIE